MKFRKKPVVIEAVQWTGTMEGLVIVRDFMSPNYPHLKALPDEVKNPSLFILTLEGTHEAKVGDWIIKGVKSEFYPCKPDIFEQTYEPIEEREYDPTGWMDDERAKTLREVGKWLEKRRRVGFLYMFYILQHEFESLKHGEMPGDPKSNDSHNLMKDRPFTIRIYQ